MGDSYKKIKHNTAKTTISISGNAEAISTNVVSLIIRNNSVIRLLTKLDSLTYLKLIKTDIESITECNWLTTAVIQDNQSITQLSHLNRLDELQCINCTGLESINLRRNTELMLDMCTSIHTIVAPNCKVAILKQCDALSQLNLGPNLIQLILCNISSMAELELPQNIKMEHLELLDCPLLQLSEVPFESQRIVIRNCPSINSLSSAIIAEIIHIDLCDNLTSITNIAATDCFVSRCSSLKEIESVQISKLSIDYCAHISEIHTQGINEIHINQCNAFKRIQIADETHTIILKDCISLYHIRTNMLPVGVIRSQSITLVGQFALEEINHLFASELIIINNSQLYNIDTVHDLTTLKLINCSELEMVSNSVISDTFMVRNCKNLHTISDIIAPMNIMLINLPKLTMSRFIFTPVQSLFIENCTRLISTFNGTWLRSLTLIDTDIIRVTELSGTAFVHIRNSKYLPNITSESNAIQLRLNLNMRTNAAMMIIRAIRKYQIRFLRQRLNAALEAQTCAICLSEVDLHHRFVSRCFHTFHADCIFTWIEVRNSCPLCNALNIC
jgi:hypothetical protein